MGIQVPLTDPKLATGDEYDVSFQIPHRHILHFKVWIVKSNDPDIEFIPIKRWLEKIYSESNSELNFNSSEMIADELAEYIQLMYPQIDGLKLVLPKDNENGCEIEYPGRYLCTRN